MRSNVLNSLFIIGFIMSTILFCWKLSYNVFCLGFSRRGEAFSRWSCQPFSVICAANSLFQKPIISGICLINWNKNTSRFVILCCCMQNTWSSDHKKITIGGGGKVLSTSTCVLRLNPALMRHFQKCQTLKASTCKIGSCCLHGYYF